MDTHTPDVNIREYSPPRSSAQSVSTRQSFTASNRRDNATHIFQRHSSVTTDSLIAHAEQQVHDLSRTIRLMPDSVFPIQVEEGV